MKEENPFILCMKHVAKHVKTADADIPILRDVNLTIKTGESIAILGTSGSGKTTLLSLIAGLDLPSQGKIIYKQQVISELTEEQRTVLRGNEMGFIFQSFQLLPSLTALENVMLPLEIHYINAKQALRLAKKWLEKVGLKHRLNHYPLQLSGGEAQRVAIARAFVNQPQVLLADEMTGNLDVNTGKMISDLVFSLNREQGTTLILVTHDVELANRCNRIMKLEKGSLQPC